LANAQKLAQELAKNVEQMKKDYEGDCEEAEAVDRM